MSIFQSGLNVLGLGGGAAAAAGSDNDDDNEDDDDDAQVISGEGIFLDDNEEAPPAQGRQLVHGHSGETEGSIAGFGVNL